MLHSSAKDFAEGPSVRGRSEKRVRARLYNNLRLQSAYCVEVQLAVNYFKHALAKTLTPRFPLRIF